MKVYHSMNSFVASTFTVHFLQEAFTKALNALFSISQIKISNNTSHSLSLYDIFNGEHSKLSTLTMFMSAQTGFLWCIEVSVTKNIMILILKTAIWDYSWGKVKLQYNIVKQSFTISILSYRYSKTRFYYIYTIVML